MRHVRHVLGASAALLAPLVMADDVYLKGGGKLSGVVVERSATMLVLETGPGRVGVPLTRVERVVGADSSLAEYGRRAARLAPGDLAGWLALAEWAHAAGLATQSRDAFERVRALDPAHPAAQVALGNVQWGGRWMSPDEARRAQGLVPFEGEWLSPEERDARVRAKSDDDAARQSRAEAAARVREAEARAAEAEADARRAEQEARAAETSTGVPLWLGGELAPGCFGACCGADCATPPSTTTPEPQQTTRREQPRPQPLVGGARGNGDGDRRRARGSALGGGSRPGAASSDPTAHDDDRQPRH